MLIVGLIGVITTIGDADDIGVGAGAGVGVGAGAFAVQVAVNTKSEVEIVYEAPTAISEVPSFHLINVYPLRVKPDPEATVKLVPSYTGELVGRVPLPPPNA